MLDVTIDELYRRVALINGVDEKEIDLHMRDPDLRLMLSLLQEYSLHLSMELEQQENIVHENLMQRLAEYLFRPVPSIAIMTYEDDSLGATDGLFRGEVFTLLSNNRSMAFSCAISSDNWLVSKKSRWDENRGALSVELCLRQPLELSDVMDKLTFNGVFLLWPEISPLSTMILNAVATREANTAFISLYGAKASQDKDHFNQNKLESNQFIGELKLKLSGDMPTIVSCENDTKSNIPALLYNYFLFPECYNGFLCYLPPRTVLNKKKNSVISMLSIQIEFPTLSLQAKGGELVNCLVNPLIVACVREESIIPFRLVNSEERLINLRNGLHDNEEVHAIKHIDCRQISRRPVASNEGKSVQTKSQQNIRNDAKEETEIPIAVLEECIYPIRKTVRRNAFRPGLVDRETSAITDFNNFVDIEKTRATMVHSTAQKKSKLDCYLSVTMPVHEINSNALELSIGGEVSIAVTNLSLASTVDLLISSPSSDKVQRMKIRFQKNGMLARKPLNAKLSVILAITDPRKLFIATTEYINQLILCSNRDYLDAKNSAISQLRCASALITKSYEKKQKNYFLGYELTIKLNMLLEEHPLLQIIAMGLSAQIIEAFSPSVVLLTRIYDAKDILLVRSSNES